MKKTKIQMAIHDTKLRIKATEVAIQIKIAEKNILNSQLDMLEILEADKNLAEGEFTMGDIERLQSEVHKITGDGAAMIPFNNLLGVKNS